jgi:hypothetical protein
LPASQAITAGYRQLSGWISRLDSREIARGLASPAATCEAIQMAAGWQAHYEQIPALMALGWQPEMPLTLGQDTHIVGPTSLCRGAVIIIMEMSTHRDFLDVRRNGVRVIALRSTSWRRSC